MQADELIQQKEWHQLSPEERRLISELADTEAEYNLIKQMLAVSALAPMEVPVISERVRENLLREMPAGNNKSKRRYVYYSAAAAAVLIIAFTIFLLQQRKADPNKPLDMVQTPSSIKTNPLPLPVIDSSVKKDLTPLQVQVIPAKEDKTLKDPTVKPIESAKKQTSSTDFSKINTQLMADTSLLAFVTEVY